jgi:hypothetical protein
MSRCFLGCAAAVAVALISSSAYAQDPQPNPPPRSTEPVAQTPPAMATAMATVEGCLVREEDVPGRKPNMAERAGVLEDYILTDAKITKGSAGPAAEPAPGAPVGTSGSKLMYEIEGIPDERLKTLVGKRVQIDGSFENVDRARAQPEARTPADDLPEIRATSIREVPGTCTPPKP